MLSLANVRYLTDEEQAQAYKERLQRHTFQISLYKCTICVTIFKNETDLLNHCNYHNKRKHYQHMCNICENRFKDETKLYEHCSERHWYAITCPVCHETHCRLSHLKLCLPKFSATRSSLNESITEGLEHIKISRLDPDQIYMFTSSVVNYKCFRCEAAYIHPVTLKTHLKHHEKRTKHWICDICKTYFDNRSKIVAHMQAYHLYKYKCTVCKKVLYANITAKRHARECLKRGSLKVTKDYCKTCGVYVGKGKLDSHIRLEHRCDCCICGEPQQNLKCLYYHQSMVHQHIRLNTVAELNDPRYYCVPCEEYFCDERAHFTHLCYKHAADNDADTADYPYENGCRRCYKLFDSSDQLNSHECVPVVKPQEVEHDYKHVFNQKNCTLCDKTLNTLEEYKQHHKTEHSGMTSSLPHNVGYLCEICGKVYEHNSSLHNHMRTHALEKAKCRFCDYKGTVIAVVQHILSSHTHRPYMCLKCPRRYETKSECRDHLLKTHAPVLPYRCEVCSRRFAHLDYLNDHCIMVHELNLKKTDPSVFLNHKMLDKIYVYPHMKIDGSLIPNEYFFEITVYSCDYMEENWESIDIMECFYFDQDIDPNVPTKIKAKKTRKYANPRERDIDPNMPSKITVKKTKYNTTPRGKETNRINMMRRQVRRYIRQNNISALNLFARKHAKDEDFMKDAILRKLMKHKTLNDEELGMKHNETNNETQEIDIKVSKTPEKFIKRVENINVYAMPVLSDHNIEEQLVESEMIEQGDDMLLLNTIIDPEPSVAEKIFKNDEVDKKNKLPVEVKLNDDSMIIDTVEESNDDHGMDNVGLLIEQDGVNYMLMDGLLYELESTEHGFVIKE